MRDLPAISDGATAVPRCPFCNVHLDYSIDATSRAAERQAVLQLTPRSANHVASPHTMPFPEEEPKQQEPGLPLGVRRIGGHR